MLVRIRYLLWLYFSYFKLMHKTSIYKMCNYCDDKSMRILTLMPQKIVTIVILKVGIVISGFSIEK
ncbi:Uncharacterised protein [Chlamydia trachomatis]|nr:Uncharacterised protein [Chlamydia trachomatis]CQB87175.1 Uncharacterised protein [Chlamydia trachomatis]CQB87178.1 Uncharacterised protein [Chlamydia trachomatis]